MDETKGILGIDYINSYIERNNLELHNEEMLTIFYDSIDNNKPVEVNTVQRIFDDKLEN